MLTRVTHLDSASSVLIRMSPTTTPVQVDILMKRSEVLLKMDVQLQQIGAKLDYIGGAIDHQSAEMRAMHQEIMAALREGSTQKNARGPSDVIQDPLASAFWRNFGLPEEADWRMLKASLKRWDRTLTEDEVEYIRNEVRSRAVLLLWQHSMHHCGWGGWISATNTALEV